MDTFDLVAPIGSGGHLGRAVKKPWDYRVTACIPHLNTLDVLETCVSVIRAQTVQPYIIVIDTGSSPAVCAELERMRSEDLEIHYIRSAGYRNASEAVTAALDLSQSLCQTDYLFQTHSDCFLMRNDVIESYMKLCNASTPVVGYRMSPRDWVTKKWEWMVGHVATLFYMPSIHRAGATWSLRRGALAWQCPSGNLGGWPDTETGFNHALRDAGIVPLFVGNDENFKRQTDDTIDHVRSYPGAKVYSPEHFAKASAWMVDAIREAKERVEFWKG